MPTQDRDVSGEEYCAGRGAMTLRIAMVATGKIADVTLAPALASVDDAQLWSVYSRDRRRAAAFAKRHGAAAPDPAFDDLSALLADPALDAVIIASPDKLHAQQAIAAARAGKHVLVEKPMATDMIEGRALVEACRAAGIKLGVAYHMRWHRGHRKLFEAAQRGDFGTLRHMRVQWTSGRRDAGNWRSNAEVGRWWSLAAFGTHCLDQVRWFMCPQSGEIEVLESVTSNAGFGTEMDETAILAIRFENGATAEVCTSVLFRSPRRMEIYGSSGYAICENTLGSNGGGEIRTNHGAFDYSVGDPYVGEIRDFVSAVRNDRDPEVSGEEGLRNVELLLQAVGERDEHT
jgi:predicted dehydrogenase